MPECDRCDRFFRTWHSYRQHIASSPRHHICDGCELDFDSWWALKQHYVQSGRHHFCRECDTHFDDAEDLCDHCINEHDYCDTCDRFFKNAQGLHEHNRQCHTFIPSHFCRECDTYFDDADELREHCVNEHDCCDICDRFFKSAHGLHEHNRQCHPYCVSCRLVFDSENSLKHHLNSSIHRPKDVQCAFYFRGCDKWFISKSAMILHLESGYCTSGATRQMIDRWVRLNDRGNVITVPQRLIEGVGVTETIATERSWNGVAYECVLCHRDFGSLDALNRHLASPRHSDRVYRCPLSSCLSTFRTLSGLCQHVESESCGVLRFRAAREVMDGVLSDMGRLRITQSRIFKVRDSLPKFVGAPGHLPKLAAYRWVGSNGSFFGRKIGWSVD